MRNIPFTGSGVALITPFKNGSVDFDKLGELIDFHINNKTDAIIVCGTTGEAATMPDAEHLSVIEYTVKKADGRIKVIAGTGSNDTAHGIELSQKAEALGADALLTVTPYYNKATQKGLVIHFNAIADAVHIPIILYSVKGRTGVNIAPQTLFELSKHPNIVAVKEASGDIGQVAEIAALCGDNLAIYSGDDNMTVPVMSLGGVGVISVIANILPEETHDLTAKFLEGDIKGARELQLHMLEIMGAMFYEVNPIPVKTAMNLLGFNVGDLRLPLCEMEEANLNKLKKALTNYGFKL